jgi:beta-lactamase regulating signal transducer with metallopeptidase domain
LLPGALASLSVMHRVRQIAYLILFVGWMLPALLAQAANDRVPKAAPVVVSPMGIVTGAEAATAPVERAVVILRVIAVLWFLVALIYATALIVRLRRTLV